MITAIRSPIEGPARSRRPLRRALALAIVEFLLLTSLLIFVPVLVGAHPGPAGAGYTVPLPPRPTVVRGYDDPPQRWQPGHRGVDLAAEPGAAVVATADGVVRFAGVVAGKPTVSVAHGDGLITTYEPVRAGVSRGARVRRGERIGTLEPGHPGCRAPACLHWGARRGTGHDAEYLNPLGLLGAVRVRLKPVGDPSAPG
ncbi:M23 family metallopeptidase [Gordonia sp. DT30]|uniref:M23 family metallopeptidase n=1 Tax=Gordonia sp. DT30 TaxID=3416546 RepID=UPI003CF6D0F1